MNEQEKKVNIKLEKHLWPDEIEKVRKKRIQKVITILGVIVAFLFGFIFQNILDTKPKPLASYGKSPISQSTQSNLISDKFNQIYEILKNEWYFKHDMTDVDNQLIDNAIFGMLEKNGDPYTEYFSAEELAEFTQSINQNFSGIGVQYYDVNGFSFVKKVFKDSPADKAGVLPGDIFYKVDGQEVFGMETETLSNLVRGEKGTDVVIEFKREEKIVPITITRDEIQSTVYGEIKEGNVGYLEINSFGLSTAKETDKYFSYFKENQVDKLIIDVRDNGGGYLTALEDIAGLLLDKGSVILQQEKSDLSISKTTAHSNPKYHFSQIHMLINENSASASEVLAAALKDNLNVTIYGVKSFGKGTVQTTTEFMDGSALKVTIAQWLTPNGNKINGVGITPDVEVKQHPVFYQSYPQLAEDDVIKVDMVDENLIFIQKALDFLGYNVDRFDGYFSLETQNALAQFIKDNELDHTPVVDAIITSKIIASVQAQYNQQTDQYDLQLNEAIGNFK